MLGERVTSPPQEFVKILLLCKPLHSLSRVYVKPKAQGEVLELTTPH